MRSGWKFAPSAFIEPGGTDTEWAPIALAEAQRYSKDGAYAQLMEAMLNSSIMQRKMPAPKVITDLLIKALPAKRPRTRYHAGAMAGPMLLLKRFLPDRIFDRLMMMALRQRGSNLTAALPRRSH